MKSLLKFAVGSKPTFPQKVSGTFLYTTNVNDMYTGHIFFLFILHVTTSK